MYHDDMSLNERIIRNDIARETSSRPLNPVAFEKAVGIALNAWQGSTYCGTAVEAGIKSVEQEVYQR